MKLQIRNKQDSFTQALAFLFRNEGDAPTLKQKLRSELVPLVTQVAIKIGSIDTEKAIRDRALAVLTGTISIHLAHTTNNKEGDSVPEWAKMVSGSDLVMLFRKGYTLMNELTVISENQISFGDWLSNIRTRTLSSAGLTRIEHLEKHVTEKDSTGMWTGYTSLNDLFETKERFEYALWLIQQAKAEQSIIDNRTMYMDSDTVVNRIILNILLSDTVSLAMDYKRIEQIVNNCYGKSRWLASAKKRYGQFLLTVPEKFQGSLTSKSGNLQRNQGYFWKMVDDWPKRKPSRNEAIQSLCLSVAVPPPDLEGIMFNPETNNLKKYEIN